MGEASGLNIGSCNATINSNLVIETSADYMTDGIQVGGNGTLTINGSVKMRKDDNDNPWGVVTKNVHGNYGPGGYVTNDALEYTGARWQPTGLYVSESRGHIVVNGDVDIAVRGTAVITNTYNGTGDVTPDELSSISLLGDHTKIITPFQEEAYVEGFGKFIEPYYSLASYGGTVNVNVKDQVAQNGKVEIVGNVISMKRSSGTYTPDVYQDGRINIGLTTGDSYWKGLIDNANLAQTSPTEKDSYNHPKYDPAVTPVDADHSGEVNLWLQNGAQWIYENASRKDGLDYKHMPEYSQSSYGSYDGMSHLSRLVGGKDSASAGIIRVKDNDPIQIAEAEGVTKVWYEHADATPGTIIGGDVKVLTAKTGTEMMLYTGNNGITKGLAEGDAAADKNNVSEVLNSLAHKLWYMAGDSNLKGSVSIAEGLTASSATMKTGNITFAEGGQGFYDYTPATDDKPYETGPIVKSENIDETRVGDVNGIVSIHVTEAQDSVADSAPSAMYVAGDAVSPLIVDLQGHTLKLNTSGDAKTYLSTVYVDADKSMEIKDSKGNGVLKVSAGLGADGNADTKANYVYGIRVGENGSFTANTDVEIDGVKSGSTQRAYGLYVGTKGNVVFEKDLTIKNVQTGNKVAPNTAGIYADSSSNADAPVNITVKGNLNIENVLGSAIRVLNSSTVSTAGATIKAADMSHGTNYSQYYALQANKGTINLNTGEGITAGILDVTGDMKVTDYATSVINVNMTKGSKWIGAVSNIPSSTYNAPAGQFNLTMSEGSVWNHETGRSVDTLKTTFAGSNVSKLDGSGVIYQNSDKGITVYNYSGDTTVVYGHDANDPLTINGGDFTIKAAAADSKITLVTDSQGITGGFADGDTAAEKNHVKEVLNKLANKLFYTGYKDANLSGIVKIADGLTASSVSTTVKASGDVTFSDGTNGTKRAGQGFYAYTPEQEKPNYKTGAITKSEDISLSRELDESGVAHVAVTESNVTSNFASAIYAGESTDPSSPMTVKMSGKGLALHAAQSSGQAAAIYAGANTYIKVINPSADQKLSIRATNTDTKGAHGIYADGYAHLNISGPVEITDIVTEGDSATGINIQGKQSEIHMDGPLAISNVKGIRERGKGINASGILVTGDSSTVTVTGPVDISGVRGSGIKLVGADTKVSVGGGTITAAEDSDHSHNFYAVRVDKGTLDINMKDGTAGDTTTKITGDMYATGQYGKKVVEYTGGELIDWNDAGILNVALTDKDSFWKGVAAYDQYNDDYGAGGNTTHDIGQFNLYLQNGATWTNEQQSHVTTTTIASKNPVWTGSTLATLYGGKDADNAGLIYQKDNNPISVVNYSGHTTVFYEHDASDPTKMIGGSFHITNAAEGSAITFITDNKGITSGFADGDSADAKDKVANVLNNLAGKLFYKNYTDGHLSGVVKIAEGLTASSAALKTGDISFSTDATGTKTPGQGFYEYTEADDSVITDPITGNLDKKYVNLGIETEKGIYNFTKDAVIDVTKGDYSFNLGAIESRGGPITIHADGLNLDVSYHVLKGSNVARAVATGNSYGIKDVTIKAKSLKLSTDTTGFYGQGVYATGGKISIDADTTISTSAQTESNGIYSGNGGTVTMNGNLTIQKDSKAANYFALKSDGNGVINVNMKDGKAGAGIVKIDGDVFTEHAESYDEWDDETTSTISTVNLALQGKDSNWNGRSLYKVTPGDDSTDYGVFNLWLADGATWTNEKNGKVVPSGFTGSRVTQFTGGSDAAHAGNIFQKDSKALTIDNYSGNTNIFYAHTGNGEAADDYAAGDTIIKKAAEGSVVSLITDNIGIAMDNEYSVANVLNALAGKLIYRAYVNGEKNLTGYVKIADGLTASSQTLQTGSIAFSKKDGKGSYADGTMTPGITYPEEQVKDSYTQAITGIAKDDYLYKQNGVLKEEGKYTFTKDPTKIAVAEGAAVNAKADITIDTTKAKLELSGKDAGIKTDGANVTVRGNTAISGKVGIDAANGSVTLNGNTVINGTDAAIKAGADGKVDITTNNSALNVKGGIHADGGSITVDSGKATGIINGDVSASNGGSVEISLNDAQSKLTGSYKVDANSGIVMNIKNGATWVLTDDKDETAGMSLLRMAKAPAAASAAGLTVNGGATKADTGYIDMTKRTQELNISNYSGYETFILAHKDDGTFTSGDVKIAKAAAGSGMTLYTANNGINMADKDAVTGMLKALAKKAFYAEGNDAGNGKNLTGEVKIGEGLTASSAKTGLMNFAEKQGQLVDGSIQWEPTIEAGDYETFVMKGARSAATTTFHSWRDNMQDTYTGADLADEDGIFAKALGGKTSSDVSGLKDSNSYWGAQVGYDKALAGGWHTGIAFDYRDGDSDYLLGGKGDNKLYSFGVYGVKKMEDGSYFRVAAKAGRVENEYDVYTELRNKLHADYKANAYGLTAEYGKTFGSEMSYITPKVQLSWSRVGSKDYTGSANNGATMDIYQDSYDSLIGRLGFEAGMKKAHGSLHAGLYLAHEFNGDIDTRYFAKDGGWKSTSFDGEDTWEELVLGGEYRLGRNSQLYADFARDLGGDFQRKWKLNAGIRLRF